MNDEIKNWDIPAIVAAAVADDPDINPDDLAASLAEIQAGQYHPVTITALPKHGTKQASHRTNLPPPSAFQPTPSNHGNRGSANPVGQRRPC